MCRVQDAPHRSTYPSSYLEERGRAAAFAVPVASHMMPGMPVAQDEALTWLGLKLGIGLGLGLGLGLG